MFKRAMLLVGTLLFLVGAGAQAQMTPWYQWTLLPPEVMDEIIGEASGETAWNTILATGGYNRDRLPEEYEGTFYEAQYVYDRLVEYGLAGAVQHGGVLLTEELRSLNRLVISQPHQLRHCQESSPP